LERKAYGRDLGLWLRMLTVGLATRLVYLAMFGVLALA